MFNRKSIYALNKKDPNAIVYTDADGNLIRLTCDDFASAAEFRRWKDWLDSDLRKEENADHKQSDNSISLEVLSEEATAVVSMSIWSRFLLTKPLYWCDFSGKVSAVILQRLSAGGCGSIVSKVSQSALLRKKNAHIGMRFGSLFGPQKKKCLNFLWKQGVQNPVFAAIGEGIIFLPAMNLDKHRLRRSYPVT